MKGKELNAVLALITTLLLLGHAVPETIRLLLLDRPFNPASPLPWALAGLVLVHAVLSLVLAVRAHRRSGSGGKPYIHLNRSTMLQRVSAMVMLLLVPLHMVHISAPRIVIALIHGSLFAAAFTHTALSFSKALITLGIGTPRFIRRADRILRVLCALLTVGSVAGLLMALY